MREYKIDTTGYKIESEEHLQNWFSWEEKIGIPKGCFYCSNVLAGEGYRYAFCEMEVGLQEPGDYVDIVYEEEKRVVAHKMI